MHTKIQGVILISAPLNFKLNLIRQLHTKLLANGLGPASKPSMY